MGQSAARMTVYTCHCPLSQVSCQCPAVSVQWGAWISGGMAAERDTVQRLDAQGIKGIDAFDSIVQGKSIIHFIKIESSPICAIYGAR